MLKHSCKQMCSISVQLSPTRILPPLLRALSLPYSTSSVPHCLPATSSPPLPIKLKIFRL